MVREAKCGVRDDKKAVGDLMDIGRVLKEAGQGDENSRRRGGGSKTRKMMTVLPNEGEPFCFVFDLICPFEMWAFLSLHIYRWKSINIRK